VIAAAAAVDTVLLVTSKGFLIRYHWDETGTERGETIPACCCGSCLPAMLTFTSGPYLKLKADVSALSSLMWCQDGMAAWRVAKCRVPQCSTA
jgi:hypothetical protein